MGSRFGDTRTSVRVSVTLRTRPNPAGKYGPTKGDTPGNKGPMMEWRG
jgi:hypothetical protein